VKPGTLAVIGMLAGLGIDIADAVPRRSRSARNDRANDGTTDEEKAAAEKRERKRARWAEACAKREAKRRVV